MWPNPQFPADFFTFTEEILNENFLCSDPILFHEDNLVFAKIIVILIKIDLIKII